MIYGKYKIEKHRNYTLYLIHPESKGSVPKVLSGSYTSVGEAISAIDSHEEKIKGIMNAKAKSNSRV
jgi:hypothetical protein